MKHFLLLHWFFSLALSAHIPQENSEEPSTSLQTFLPPVEVVGSRPGIFNLPPGEISGESYSINQENTNSVEQALKMAPFLDTRLSGGEGSTPQFIVRGFETHQQRFFLEGVPLTDAAFNSHVGSAIPIQMISQIDVYPEGVPVILADDGLGAAIHLRLDPFDGPPRSSFGARLGSFEYGKGQTKSEAQAFLPTQVYLSYQRARENFLYFDDNGTPFNFSDDAYLQREHNQFQRFIVMPRFWFFKHGKATLQLFSFNQFGTTEVPGPVQIPIQGDLTQFFHLSAIRYDRQVSKYINQDSTFYFRGLFEEVKMQSGLAPNRSDSRSKNISFGLRNRFFINWKSYLGLEGVLGVSLERYQGTQASVPTDQNAKEKLAVPMGLSATLRPGQNWEVRPAVLLAWNRYGLTGESAFDQSGFAASRDKNHLLASPRLGLATKLQPNWRIRSSVGQVYRSPTLYELFGGPSGIVPSPNLTYEESLKGELGTDAVFVKPTDWLRTARFSYTYHLGLQRNEIIYTQNSQNTRVAINLARSRIEGHELMAKVDSQADISWSWSFALLNTRNLTDISYQYGKELPGRPTFRSSMQVSYDRVPWGMGYELSLKGPSYWDTANQKQMPAYWDHGAYVKWKHRLLGEFRLEGTNLSDSLTAPVAYETHSINSIDNTTGILGYPAPGRRIYLTWNTEF